MKQAKSLKTRSGGFESEQRILNGHICINLLEKILSVWKDQKYIKKGQEKTLSCSKYFGCCM